MRVKLVLIVIASFAVGAVAALALMNLGNPRAPLVATTGKALVGGPFAMVDHTGRRVTDEDFRGRFMLVFFGFTHCPDICPAELQVMGAALESLGPRGEEVVPLFVTVDPERDTVEQMASYVSHFHPRLVGLTGTQDEVAAMAKAYRVYFARAEDPDSSAGYTVDHSAIVYLMDRQGEYAAHFAYGVDAVAMAEGIARHLDASS